DIAEWIGAFQLFDQCAIAVKTHLVTEDLEDDAGRQADDGVAPPLFAAMNRFEQIGIGPAGELEVSAEGGIEVGEDIAADRDTVVIPGGQLRKKMRIHGEILKQNGYRTGVVTAGIALPSPAS